eukprot:2294681-Rhodomonas_salina.2
MIRLSTISTIPTIPLLPHLVSPSFSPAPKCQSSYSPLWTRHLKRRIPSTLILLCPCEPPSSPLTTYSAVAHLRLCLLKCPRYLSIALLQSAVQRRASFLPSQQLPSDHTPSPHPPAPPAAPSFYEPPFHPIPPILLLLYP